MDELYLSKEFIYCTAQGVNGNVAGIDDCGSALVLVSGSRRHHEQGLHAIMRKAFDYTLAGGSQTTCNVGRKFPTEHQDSLEIWSPCAERTWVK